MLFQFQSEMHLRNATSIKKKDTQEISSENCPWPGNLQNVNGVNVIAPHIRQAVQACHAAIRTGGGAPLLDAVDWGLPETYFPVLSNIFEVSTAAGSMRVELLL